MSYAQIAQSFSVQTEATNMYPYLANPYVATVSTFLTQVYKNLFNRAPDSAGLTYWTNEINSGRSNVGNAIINIISGAQDNAAAGTLDLTTLNNVTSVGLNWANTMATIPGATYNSAAAVNAAAVISGVTSAASTVTAANAATATFFANGGGITGSTFAAQTGLDNFAGAGSFNFVDIAGATTWTAGDTVTGTGNNNTINIVSGSAIAAPAGSTVTGVQTANITSGATIGSTTAISTTGWTGLNTLNLTGVGTVAATAATSTAVNVTDSSFAATTMTINGGGNVSITATGNTTGGTLNEGQTTANTGTTTISLTSSTTAATGAVINAKGGTTVTITDTMTNTATGAAVQAVVGAIGVTGTSATTSVSVTQSGGVTGAVAVTNNANTRTAVSATSGVTNAAVTIADANAGSATAAATIRSVTLQNYGASTISSNALTTLTLSNTGTTASGTLGLTYGLTTGNPTTLALNLNGGSLGVITDNGNKLATFNTVLSANTTLAGITDTAARTLALSGTGVLTLSATNTALTSITEAGAVGLNADLSGVTGITSFNFATASGANTVTLNAATQAYAGGLGSDVVTIGVDALRAISGGGGTDTLVLSATAATYTTNTYTNVTGFNNLRVTHAAGGSYDMSKFTGYTGIQDTGATNTFTKVTAGTTLALQAATTAIVYQVSDTAGATDSVAVTLSGTTVTAANGGGTAGFTTTALTLQDANSVGIGTVSINSDASVFQGLHTIITLTDNNLSSLAITGTGSLSITNQTNVSTGLTISDNGTGASATADGIGTLTSTGSVLGNISYSGTHAFTIGALADSVANLTITNANTGSSGVLTVSHNADTALVGLNLNGSVAYTLAASATAAVTVSGASDNQNVSLNFTGSTGVDTITLGNGANTIITGASNDVITLGTGANTVTAGAGNDTITLGSHSASTVDTIRMLTAVDNGTDTIVGLNAATDVFNTSAAARTGATTLIWNPTAAGATTGYAAGAAAFVTSAETSSTATTAATLTAGNSILVLTGTLIQNTTNLAAAVKAALTVQGSTGGGRADFEVLWSDGTNAYLSDVSTTAHATGTTVLTGDTVSATNLVQFTGVTNVTSFAAANFAIIA